MRPPIVFKFKVQIRTKPLFPFSININIIICHICVSLIILGVLPRVMAQANPDVECGLCMRRGENLEEPKTLPCQHAHCERCLVESFESINIVQCPHCREVFDIDLNSLLNASTEGDNSVSCDVCERDGIQNQPAMMYCTDCVEKYCNKHLESHDDANEDHHRINIEEYKRQARKLQIIYCPEHEEEAYKSGCKVCLAVFCAQCMFEKKTCSSCPGAPHDLLTLDQLVAELTKEINELKTEVINKEENLSSLFKLISKAISDYQTSTEEMIETLHQTRDRQIEAIKVQYDNLETELVKLRAQSLSEMTRYMEEDVGIKLSELSNHRLRIEAKLRDSHQVDIVNGYRDVKDELQRLISEDMPLLQLTNSVSLVSNDGSRDIEVKIVPSTYDSIDRGLTTPEPSPTSITLLQTVEVSSQPYSVCHSKGYTYVGLRSGGIDRIDKNYQLAQSFIRFSDSVESITVYNDRIYSLALGSPRTVYVHSLTGQLITKWNHTDENPNLNKLSILSDQVVIPDRANKRLSVYSLTGQKLKHISCPQLGDDDVAMCAVAVGNDTVIVSDYDASLVFRVNITSGEVIWKSEHLANPQGVACYGHNSVCVASADSNIVQILSTKTGEVLSEVTDNPIRDGNFVFDLHISGRTLIVPTYLSWKLLFYQLNP